MLRGQGRHAKRVNPPVGAVVALVGVCAAAVVAVTVWAATSSSSGEPAARVQPAATTIVAAPRDPTTTPQARALLGELYKEGVGPGVLSPQSAVLVADGVCQARAQGKSLVAMTGAVRGALRQLTPLQGHRFVDLSVKYFCGEG